MKLRRSIGGVLVASPFAAVAVIGLCTVGPVWTLLAFAVALVMIAAVLLGYHLLGI